MANHDEHYRKIESDGRPEPFAVESYLHDKLLSAGIDRESVLAIVMGVKHIQRSGTKAGEDWQKEIDKTANYFHRALTEKWIVEEGSRKLDFTVSEDEKTAEFNGVIYTACIDTGVCVDCNFAIETEYSKTCQLEKIKLETRCMSSREDGQSIVWKKVANV